jgi:flagellar protein FliS
MSYASARRTYMTAAVQTVPPGQLLVMLYDGLLRNLDQAEVALARRDLPATHMHLIKAQAIVSELDVSLDTSAWPAGEGLKALYRFVEAELITANVAKDVARIRACRELIAPLAEAWRAAAGGAPASAPTAAEHLITTVSASA